MAAGTKGFPHSFLLLDAGFLIHKYPLFLNSCSQFLQQADEIAKEYKLAETALLAAQKKLEVRKEDLEKEEKASHFVFHDELALALTFA